MQSSADPRKMPKYRSSDQFSSLLEASFGLLKVSNGFKNGFIWTKKFVWAWQNFSITVYRIPVATKFQKVKKRGSGGGSVGRAVTSNTRDPRFESQYRQTLIYQLYILIEKMKIKKKRPGMAHLYKNLTKHQIVPLRKIIAREVFRPTITMHQKNS